MLVLRHMVYHPPTVSAIHFAHSSAADAGCCRLMFSVAMVALHLMHLMLGMLQLGFAALQVDVAASSGYDWWNAAGASCTTLML